MSQTMAALRLAQIRRSRLTLAGPQATQLATRSWQRQILDMRRERVHQMVNAERTIQARRDCLYNLILQETSGDGNAH